MGTLATQTTAWTLGGFYLLWIFYLAVMSLYRAHKEKKLTLMAKVFGYPVLAVGAIIDALINIVPCTILALDPPKEFLTTQRLERYLSDKTGWRYKVAYFVCSQLLDTFDPSGIHCKNK